MNAIKNYILAKYFHFSSELQEALVYLANTLAPVENMSELKIVEVTISAANIVATSAGAFGHASGVALVSAPGAGKYVEFVRATLLYDYSTAAYTGGGNITVNATGGSAVTGLVSAANSVGGSADAVVQFYPLTTAGVVVAANTGLSLVAASAFTQPGTAAGTIKVRVEYKVHSF